MFIDYENLFSNAQAVTVTAASTNVIDLGANHAYIQTLFEKGMVGILAQVHTTFAGGTSVAIQLQTDSDEAFGTVETLYATPAIATATLAAGYRFRLSGLPLGIKRYVRLNYVVVGTHTAGKITAGLVLDLQSNGV